MVAKQNVLSIAGSSAFIGGLVGFFRALYGQKAIERELSERIVRNESRVEQLQRLEPEFRRVLDNSFDIRKDLLDQSISLEGWEDFLESYLDQKVPEILDRDSRNYRGAKGLPGEAGPMGRAGPKGDPGPQGPIGPKGEDGSAFIVYPLSEQSFEVRKLNTPFQRKLSETFIVRRVEKFNSCTISDNTRKRISLYSAPDEVITDICKYNTSLLHFPFGSKFGVSGVEVTISSDNISIEEQFEVGADYSGNEYPLRLEFSGGIVGGSASVMAVPGDVIYLVDKDNRAVEFSVHSYGRREKGMFVSIFFNQVDLVVEDD